MCFKKKIEVHAPFMFLAGHKPVGAAEHTEGTNPSISTPPSVYGEVLRKPCNEAGVEF